MPRYVLTRLAASSLTLFGLSVLVFGLLLVIPGTVAEQIIGIEGGGTPEAVAALRAKFGLDQPLLVRYGTWLAGAVIGDFGDSWRTGEPVLQTVLSRLPLTMEIALLAVLGALLIGIPLGVVAAVRRNSAIDHATRLLMLLGASVPIYVLGSVLLLVLSTTIGWIPPTGYTPFLVDPIANLSTVIVPSAALAVLSAAAIARMTRGSVLEVMNLEYVRTARSKGLSEGLVVSRHTLRNALIPVITIAGLEFGTLLGGAVITEVIFSLPGIGRLVVDSIAQRDYPVVQATIMIVGALFVLVNLGTDLLYVYVNPRVRFR